MSLPGDIISISYIFIKWKIHNDIVTSFQIYLNKDNKYNWKIACNLSTIFWKYK